MNPIASTAIIDPLRAFIDGGVITGTERRISLISTRFDVRIAHGMAVISTDRAFRNDEPESIEATITFPVPVHAVLFDLAARIGGRVLKAKAQRKTDARETYEDALERGKTAVLHEEVLRGVHMLSVGHVPAGAEVVVSTTWAITLTNINGIGRLRIPLTVGEIYGRSRLPDADDLIHGGSNGFAQLTVSCVDGQARLIGGSLRDGRTQVPLDAPIDLEVTGWMPRDLVGRAADGRKVALRIEPSATGESALDLAVVVDRSGSMRERCSDGCTRTKHAAIIRSLQGVTSIIGLADAIDVWEFSDDLNYVGSTRDGQSLKAIASRVARPDGGTNIGRALEGVAARGQARDVLLVTDGKSHELDVLALTRTGHRYTVVLVGEDSLEANVGHLAALSGGEVFVASGADFPEVLNQSLRSLRTGYRPVSRAAGSPESLSVSRAGMTIAASWSQTEEELPDSIEGRAVAAISASLALPVLDVESAGRLAENEGLVTHLTSLVLVDESASAQDGIPAMRKIPLPTPRTLRSPNLAMSASAYPEVSSSMMMDQITSRYLPRAAPPATSLDMRPLEDDIHVSAHSLVRLRQLIDQSPSGLQPNNSAKLLKEAGLGPISDELARHAQHLGVKPDAVLAIVLAGLLGSRFADCLSTQIQDSAARLRQFAEHAMKALRRLGDDASSMAAAIQDVRVLDVVEPSCIDQIGQAAGRLAGCSALLAHIEQVIAELGRELDAAQPAAGRPAGYHDLSRVGAQVDWEASPERLRRGDLSGLDRSIARAIQDAAALAEAIRIASTLGIDPVSLIIGLLARGEAQASRTARRLARSILGDSADPELSRLMSLLQLH